MQFEHALPSVEHAAEVLAQPPGDVLYLDFGHQVQVEFGAQRAQETREDLGAFFRRLVIGQFMRTPRRRRTPPSVDRSRGRLVGKASADDDRLQVDVEPCRDKRLVAAGDHDELVDEFVVGASPFAHLLAQRPFLGIGHLFDDEHFEIRPLALRRRLVLELAGIGREHVQFVGAGVVDVPER